MSPALAQYDWIIAIISLAFCGSAFGNGANDVSNSFATSVAARTLTMAQAGVIAMVAEFLGALVLGARVTGTIKNKIIELERYQSAPSTLLVVMGAAEIGSATWLLVATKLEFPVSTTHTIVGALIGAGIASQASVSWAWSKGSASQIAASWLLSPLISACLSALLFASLKFCVLERVNSFEIAMKAIPFYLAFTAAVLALFITIEAPGAPSLEELGAGRSCGIVLGVFFGALVISYVFFIPYFKRVVVLKDHRMRPWHIPLGPLLLKDNPPLYFPGKTTMLVDHYENAYEKHDLESSQAAREAATTETSSAKPPADTAELPAPTTQGPFNDETAVSTPRKPVLEPEERFLAPTVGLPIYHPRRIRGLLLYFFLQGVTRDVVSHQSAHLSAVHSKAPHYDNRVEHLWTYAQVASAIMMAIAHGSNDVANAVGPWVAAYDTYLSGEVTEDNDTPVWILAIAGFLIGAGFWFMGWHIVRALGNKITLLSPTRGYAMELGAAITVLMASRLGLPISTTQTLTGAVLGVALMNLDIGATNWKQMAYIFAGWLITLPVAGLMSGLLTVMALNAPQFS